MAVSGMTHNKNDSQCSSLSFYPSQYNITYIVSVTPPPLVCVHNLGVPSVVLGNLSTKKVFDLSSVCHPR